jgi:hypothetical protein
VVFVGGGCVVGGWVGGRGGWDGCECVCVVVGWKEKERKSTPLGPAPLRDVVAQGAECYARAGFSAAFYTEDGCH